MGKRKSKSIEAKDLSEAAASEVPQEMDVAGPLSLEEAKAVGDVPEDFKVEPENGGGGILKRASSLLTGGDATPAGSAGEEPARKSVTFAEEPEVAEAEADASSAGATKEEKAERKKSFLNFLHLNKKKKNQPSDTDVIKEEPTAEENASGTAAKGAEKADAEAPAAASEARIREDEHEAPAVAEGAPPSAEPAETAADSAKPKRRKSVLDSLFHRKEKTQSSADEPQQPIADTEAPAAAEKAEKTEETAEDAAPPGEEAKEKAASTAAAIVEPLPDINMKDVQEPSAAAAEVDTEDAAPAPEASEEAAPPPSTKKAKKKSILSMFSKKKESEEAPTPPPTEQLEEAAAGDAEAKAAEASGEPADAAEDQAGEAAQAPAAEKPGLFERLFRRESEKKTADSDSSVAGAAGGAAAVGAGVGAATAVAATSEHDKASTSPESPAAETHPAEKSQKRPFWSTVYPQPSPDATVVKEGPVLKMGYIFQVFRPRYLRIMSDGLLQTSRSSDWSAAKGVNLTANMTMEASENPSKTPYILKISIPSCKNFVLGFQDQDERDAWISCLEDMKARLQAATPDDGHEHVMKSSSVEEPAGTSGGTPSAAVEVKA